MQYESRGDYMSTAKGSKISVSSVTINTGRPVFLSILCYYFQRQKTVGREVRNNAFPVTPKTLSIVII